MTVNGKKCLLLKKVPWLGRKNRFKNICSSIFMKDLGMNSSNTHDPISAAGVHFKSEYISASDDVKLKVLQWQPEIKEPGEPEKSVEPVIFVPGWISHVSSWAELLPSMTQKRPVFYIETREKISAQIRKEKIGINDFTIPRIALDIINVCKRLPIDLEKAIVMGSSFGATALLEALKNNNLNVRCAFLVGPNSEFSAHPLMQKLLLLPDFSSCGIFVHSGLMQKKNLNRCAVIKSQLKPHIPDASRCQ
jgi:hypothetical protein